jgi:hypothetical protein
MRQDVFPAMRLWSELAETWWHSGFVIQERLWRLALHGARGHHGRAEQMVGHMIAEKQRVLMESAFKAWLSLALAPTLPLGQGLAASGRAGLRPIRRKVKANARRR